MGFYAPDPNSNPILAALNGYMQYQQGRRSAAAAAKTAQQQQLLMALKAKGVAIDQQKADDENTRAANALKAQKFNNFLGTLNAIAPRVGSGEMGYDDANGILSGAARDAGVDPSAYLFRAKQSAATGTPPTPPPIGLPPAPSLDDPVRRNFGLAPRPAAPPPMFQVPSLPGAVGPGALASQPSTPDLSHLGPAARAKYDADAAAARKTEYETDHYLPSQVAAKNAETQKDFLARVSLLPTTQDQARETILFNKATGNNLPVPGMKRPDGTFQPRYAMDAKTAADVAGTLASTAQTQKETALLDPKFQLQQKQILEDIRHHKATEGLTASGQQVTMRGQDMTAQTAANGQGNTNNRNVDNLTAGYDKKKNDALANIASYELMLQQPVKGDDGKMRPRTPQELAAIKNAIAIQQSIVTAADQNIRMLKAIPGSSIPSGGVTSSGGINPLGIQNGRPSPALTGRVGKFGNLVPSFADGLNAMFTEAKRQGINLGMTDGFRDYATQVDLKKRKPFLAATPGMSNHGFGAAADLSGDAKALAWAQANAPRFGLHFPMLKQGGGHKYEPWHVELAPGAARTAQQPHPSHSQARQPTGQYKAGRVVNIGGRSLTVRVKG